MTQGCRKQHHAIESITALLSFVHKTQWGLRGLWVLPASDPIYPGRMGGKKKRSIKGLGHTGPWQVQVVLILQWYLHTRIPEEFGTT